MTNRKRNRNSNNSGILGFKNKEIENLIMFVNENDINELEIKEGSKGLKIKKSVEPIIAEVPITKSAAPIRAKKPQKSIEQKKPAVQVDKSKYHIIKSPIVGTFYRSPSPDSPSFVNAGDTVNKNSVLGIVEAMKVMNRISSDISGKVVKILMKNAEPVKAGDELFYLDKV